VEAKMFDLSGKVAVITGSTRGIGRAIAEQMVLHGAKCVISGRYDASCKEAADEINAMVRAEPGEATAVSCDILYKDQLENLVNQTIRLYGQIDILVCNAAINVYVGSFMGIPDEAFDLTMDVNVRSNHWLCQMVLPGMAERKQGVVIIISSISGIRGTGMLGTYGLTKAAVSALTRNIAVEYGPKNIRANAILPGLIQTELSRPLRENEEFLKQRIASTPLRRIGKPKDIAGAAVFLASDAASFMTGQTLVIDGGVTV